MKKILFLFLVALMLVSCDSPVQENDNEKQTVETTQETKVEEKAEETKESVEEIKPEEKKPQEETKKQAAEETVEETVEETKEEPVETEVVEQPEEVVEPEEPQETVEEPVEETPVEQPVEEPTEEVVEEPAEEQPEEIIEQPVVVDTWIKVNYTDGTFGIPYFAVPKGYDPMNFNRNFITEEFRNSNFLKFKKVNQTLVHKNKDNYKSSTFAFWKGDSQARTFEAEVDVYEVYIYSTYTEDSVYITYDDLFTTEKNYNKPAFLLRNENGAWNVYSALTSNGEVCVPEDDLAKRTNTVLTKYN